MTFPDFRNNRKQSPDYSLQSLDRLHVSSWSTWLILAKNCNFTSKNITIYFQTCFLNFTIDLYSHSGNTFWPVISNLLRRQNVILLALQLHSYLSSTFSCANWPGAQQFRATTTDGLNQDQAGRGRRRQAPNGTCVQLELSNWWLVVVARLLPEQMTPNSCCSFRACALEPANPWIQPYNTYYS